jgi:hypothetical protein
MTMPLRRHVKERAFTPEQISRLIAAFEDILTALHITDRTEPIAERIAQAMIEVADNEPECTAAALKARTLAALGLADA